MTEFVIEKLSLGEISLIELEDKKLYVLQARYLQRRREIRRIMESFSGDKAAIFPDVLWKEICAAEEVLRAFTEFKGLSIEEGIVFLDSLLANLGNVEAMPVLESFTLAKASLERAVTALDDAHLEETSGQVRLTLKELKEAKELLRPAQVRARIARFLCRAC